MRIQELDHGTEVLGRRRYCAKNFRPSQATEKGSSPYVGVYLGHIWKKKNNQAWLKTVGKVVTLIFLFLPSSQNQGRKAAQYHKDPDEAHQHFWKACAHV